MTFLQVHTSRSSYRTLLAFQKVPSCAFPVNLCLLLQGNHHEDFYHSEVKLIMPVLELHITESSVYFLILSGIFFFFFWYSIMCLRSIQVVAGSSRFLFHNCLVFHRWNTYNLSILLLMDWVVSTLGLLQINRHEHSRVVLSVVRPWFNFESPGWGVGTLTSSLQLSLLNILSKCSHLLSPQMN